MKVISFVVCEQIRREDSGKFILLGVFTSNRIQNISAAEARWVQAFPFSFLISLSLNRQTDVGSYHIQLRLQNKCENTLVMRLDVNPEGNDYFSFPISILIPFSGPDTAILEAIRLDDDTQSIEIGRFEFVDG